MVAFVALKAPPAVTQKGALTALAEVSPAQNTTSPVAAGDLTPAVKLAVLPFPSSNLESPAAPATNLMLVDENLAVSKAQPAIL